MYPFQLYRPSTLREALELYNKHPGSCILAGGTDAMISFRAGKRAEARVIDILLPELTGIKETDGAFEIGACTALFAISGVFRTQPQPYCVLQETAESVGACQTRHTATIGGNICTGNASADMATALLVLDAVLTAASVHGSREIPIDRFFVRNRQTVLQPGEILTSIRIPKRKNTACGAAFMKLGKRRGHVIATLNTAALIGTDPAGTICEVRLAAGTLAPTPVRLYESEKILLGAGATPEEMEPVLRRVEEKLLTEIQPRNSLRASREYRESTAPVALTRTIRRACGQEETL